MSRRGRRGLVLLYLSYGLVLCLTMLVTGLFVRTGLNLNQATWTLASEQAFWNADGGIDAAMADLAANGPPALSADPQAANHCAQQAAYRICLMEDASSVTQQNLRYEVEGLGAVGGAVQQPVADIRYQANALKFEHALFGAKRVSVWGVDTATVDTQTSPRLVPLAVAEGHLATSATRVPPVGPTPVEVAYGSVITGDVFVGPGAEHPSSLVSYPMGGYVSGSVKQLAVAPVLWKVQVPPGAVNLGSVTIVSSQDDRCLAAGTYVARDLVVSGRGTLCTTGDVHLFVTHELAIADGSVYGQPAGSAPFGNTYSSEALHLWYTGATDAVVGVVGQSGSTLVVGTIYAPKAEIVLTASTSVTVAGGIIAETITAATGMVQGGGGGNALAVYYDLPLKERRLAVGDPTIAVQAWRRSSTVSSGLSSGGGSTVGTSGPSVE